VTFWSKMVQKLFAFSKKSGQNCQKGRIFGQLLVPIFEKFKAYALQNFRRFWGQKSLEILAILGWNFGQKSRNFSAKKREIWPNRSKSHNLTCLKIRDLGSEMPIGEDFGVPFSVLAFSNAKSGVWTEPWGSKNRHFGHFWPFWPNFGRFRQSGEAPNLMILRHFWHFGLKGQGEADFDDFCLDFGNLGGSKFDDFEAILVIFGLKGQWEPILTIWTPNFVIFWAPISKIFDFWPKGHFRILPIWSEPAVLKNRPKNHKIGGVFLPQNT